MLTLFTGMRIGETCALNGQIVTANHPQPMTKLAKNDIITLKANRNLKGVRYHGKNTRDKKAGASQ
ncbi:MAG: hypothetical protein K6C68_05280, partial [Ruminococcus sp.]|nr:hypothetical protein [Ruminococcus sp.]